VAAVGSVAEAVDFAEGAAQLEEPEVLQPEVGQYTGMDRSHRRPRSLGHCESEEVPAVEEAHHVERLSMSDWALDEAAAEVLHEVL
jgi:hypothetical protein